VVTLETGRAHQRADFRIGLEAISKGTGRLSYDESIEYDGDGIAFTRGDVLFGKLRPNLAKAWLADRDGEAVGDFHVYRPVRSRMTSRYLAYLVLSDPFLGPVIASVYGAKMPRADWNELRNIEVWAPDLPEQRAIADFLDRETAQIDAFIAKNEQLITLLTERRAATTAMLGEEHVGGGPRLKHHISEVDVRAGSIWSDMPLLSVSISWGVRRRDEVTADAPQALDMAGYKVAEAGDIVLNRMRAFQGALGCAPERGLVSPDYAVLRSRGGADPNWLSLVMRTPRFVGEMTSRLKGIGGTESGAVRTPRINVADLNEIRVSVPTPSKQAAQTLAVQRRVADIDRAAATATRSVELARERRAALISAAVTGKIDVGVNA